MYFNMLLVKYFNILTRISCYMQYPQNDYQLLSDYQITNISNIFFFNSNNNLTKLENI